MKKHLAAILILLSLGIFSWGQTSKDLFDVKKSQTEIEIMKGILSTTISYIAQSYQKAAFRFNASSISGYYLVGQGAVFVISTSGFRPMSPFSPYIEMIDAEMSQQLEYVRENAQAIAQEAQQKAYQPYRFDNSNAGSGVGKETSETVHPPAPPAPPAPVVSPTPPAPAAPPATPQVDREQLRKKVEDYQARIKKSRDEAETNREKFLENLKEIRVYLVEALANYGDSLTTVKPSEYINLVLYTDSFDSDFGRMKVRSDVISAQKSWITDYKAGRLSLENFKQKVLQYTQ